MKIGLSLQIDFEDVKHLLASYLDIQSDKMIQLSRDIQDCAIDIADEKSFSDSLNRLSVSVKKLESIQLSIVEIGELYTNYANVVTNGPPKPKVEVNEVENAIEPLEQSIKAVEGAIESSKQATKNVEAYLEKPTEDVEEIDV